MLEAHALFQRWDAARRAGSIATDPEPDEPLVLPEDRARHQVLERNIATTLRESRPIATMRGHFEYKPDRVRWTPVTSARPHRDLNDRGHR